MSNRQAILTLDDSPLKIGEYSTARAKDGLFLFYLLKGNPQGPLIVFLHGGPGEEHYFTRLVGRHFESNYLCLYFDQRGYGRSEKPLEAGQLTLDRLISNTVELIRAVGGLVRMASLHPTLILCAMLDMNVEL